MYPEYILKMLRQRDGLDEDDKSNDDVFNSYETHLAKEMGLNAADLNGEIFDVGDKVALISHGDSENIYYEPEIGTVGIVRDAGDVCCFVQWPDQSTEAGRDGNDDSWSVDNYKLKKIP